MSEATQAEVASKTNGSSGFMTPNPMDQNGGSNGHGATSLPAAQMQPSSSATPGKSPKKRRKVNHGTLCDRKRLNPRPSMSLREYALLMRMRKTDSLCILSPIGEPQLLYLNLGIPLGPQQLDECAAGEDACFADFYKSCGTTSI